MMRYSARRKLGFPSMLLVAIVIGAAQAGGLARSAEEPAAQGEHGAKSDSVLIDWTFSPLRKLAASDGVDEGNIHSDWTYSASGNLAVSAGLDGNIRLWDLQHGTAAVLGSVNQPYHGACFAISGDEERILIGAHDVDANGIAVGNIRLWSIAEGGEIRRIALPASQYGYYYTTRLAYVGGSRRLLASCESVWGSPHGGGTAGFVRLFDAETGDQLHSFRSQLLGDVSEDGRFALMYGFGRYGINSAFVDLENALYLVDLETYETLRQFEHPGVDGARFDDAESVIVSQSDDGVVIRWDRETGEQLRPDEKP